ncbi:GAF domain-containing protein [Aquabacterium soli]|jgi:GAF domain-containing protein|uniref:GAF domain-containing protein n=1 Tax=Aquabacterium soli TaxID=2493092 RepID=A0A426VAY8_9BURK|nr:GAF domain-containing protein [Aquabacterium soli]RRS04095.1 GAF domain-containing protein [Aquabacterium soli]
MPPSHEFMSELRAAADVLAGPEGLTRYRQLVAEALYRRFQCSMASLWLLREAPAGRFLECVAAFSENPELNAAGTELHEKDFQVYFDTLIRTKVYNSPDAQEDPHLAGLKDSYLLPQGVRALLDVAFQINGQPLGVLCIEQRETPRIWSKVDEVDLRNAASVIGISIARHRNDEQQTSVA